MSKVLITGGTGLIGRRLSKMLVEKGYDVAVLTRSETEKGQIPKFHWDYRKGEIDETALDYCGYIVHLAGVNIGARRWTRRRKRDIIDSRVKSAGFLFEILKEKKISPKAFISASGISYYGAVTSDRIFEESDNPGTDFIGGVCVKWEKAADQFASLGARIVKLRTGIVLSGKGGALKKMLTPFKFRTKAILGSGKQYFPWIHFDDICEMYLKVVDNENIEGVYNAVAEEQLNYAEIIKEMTLLSKRPLLNIKVPALMMKVIFGEMSEILLKGSRAANKRIINAGYTFKYPLIKPALKNILKK